MKSREQRQSDYWNGLASLPPETSVFDPTDARGEKNAYIAGVRDRTLHSALRGVLPKDGAILDFGCGTGSASLGLLRCGYRVVGLDIARSLLIQARKRCDTTRSLFAAIDGNNLPVATSIFDAAVTYVVLSYIVDDDALLVVLTAIRESLKPSARLIAIEQCRTRTTLVEDGLKVHRSIAEWHGLFKAAGFRQVTNRTVRSGRFPFTPLIRLGLIPRGLWPAIRASERTVGRLVPILPFDYAEVALEGVA